MKQGLKNISLMGYVLLLTFFFLGYFYIPDPTFDLYRYYEFYKSFDERGDFFKNIVEVVDYNFDFIYFLTFMLLKQIGVSPNFANGFYVSLYYGAILSFVYSVTKGEFRIVYVWAIVFSVLAVPIIYTLSISRTVASLAFFFWALRFDSCKKILPTILMLLASVFTHIGMVLFIFPTLVLLKAARYFVWKRWFLYVYLIAFAFCLSSASWMNSVFGMFSAVPFFDQFTRYEIYLEQATSIFADLAYYDVIPVIWLLIASVFMFVRLKRHTAYTLTCGLLLLVFALFLNYSTMFAQRTVMFVVPFVAILFFEFQKQSNRRYFGLSTGGVLVIAFSFAAYAINLLGYRAYLANSF